jgi:uncharacterized NAD(P)/FAD-binding protein YdhS
MSAPSTATPRQIVIIGGGYSGVSAALQLLRAVTPVPAIRIVEPRAQLGAGLAYATTDPDHRLNGTIDIHPADPHNGTQLPQWCESTALLAADPDARAADGRVFIRRRDFAAFLAHAAGLHPAAPHSGAGIGHVRATAFDIALAGNRAAVRLDDGTTLAADFVILATGNAPPRLPAPFAGTVDTHPGVIADPLSTTRVREIAPNARVLVLGSGLTALDAISTLLRAGHAGPITALSRRGLRPRPYRPLPTQPDTTPPKGLLERVLGPVPPFVLAAGTPPTARSLLRALRQRIDAIAATGEAWFGAFDEMRDALWRFWPAMAVAEKKRVLRRLRPWYDAHRFRAPPQNAAMVAAAEAAGLVRYRTARVAAVRSDDNAGPILVTWTERGQATATGHAFDAVINCTGLDPAAGARANPVLGAMMQAGLLRIDASGIGFEVDADCRPVGRDGSTHDRLRLIGPPTAGTFGDPLGAAFIAAQIARIMPSMVESLNRS